MLRAAAACRAAWAASTPALLAAARHARIGRPLPAAPARVVAQSQRTASAPAAVRRCSPGARVGAPHARAPRRRRTLVNDRPRSAAPIRHLLRGRQISSPRPGITAAAPTRQQPTNMREARHQGSDQAGRRRPARPQQRKHAARTPRARPVRHDERRYIRVFGAQPSVLPWSLCTRRWRKATQASDAAPRTPAVRIA